jgi:uncharacterized protein (TIGR03067 family)
MSKARLLGFIILAVATSDLAAVVDRMDRKKVRTPNYDPVKEDMKRLEGAWDYAVSRGDLAVTIRAGTYTSADSKGNVVLAAVMKIDPTRTPKWLDMTYIAGPLKGQTLQAIYELKGDMFTLCIQMDGTGRPNAFRKDGNFDFCVLRRQKKAR